jgi:Bacterial mobilisation protein (MobC)
MASRSGSEKRKRTRILSMRFNDEEAAAIFRMAQSRGQSVAALVRSNVLGVRSRPSRVDLQAVARLLGQLGKIGSNINQIAYHLNAGRPGDRVEGSLEEALRDLSELRIVCLQALGKEPRRGASPNDEAAVVA